MNHKPSPRSILVTGASGQLGPYVLERLASDGHTVTAWSGRRTGRLAGVPLRTVDLASVDAVQQAFEEANPDVVVHLAAVSSIAEARRDPDRAARVNTRATEQLAKLCQVHESRLIYLSTDLVFDGEQAPYAEEDEPNPLSVYARTKLAAEASVLATSRALVLRLSLLFGPSRSGGTTFFDQQVATLRERRPMHLFDDEWRTPLSLPAAADAIAAAVGSEATGLLHVGGPDRLSRYEMGRLLAEQMGADASVFVPTSRLQASGELRPRDTSLASRRWNELFPEVHLPRCRDMIAALVEQDLEG